MNFINFEILQMYQMQQQQRAAAAAAAGMMPQQQQAYLERSRRISWKSMVKKPVDVISN